ncbi:MAG TPA: HAD family phosphatase [Actinomycetota bacterium]
MGDIRGLLIDFGGVLTGPLGEAFERFCAEEGVDPSGLREALKSAYHDQDPEHFVSLVETGRMEVEEFERRLAEVLSEGLDRPVAHEGLVDRMVAGIGIEEGMVDLVRRARAAGVRTALVSNSWGLHYYPTSLLEELFDTVVISGQVGLRKPLADIYRLAADRLSLPPEACLFVDDFPPNVEAAQALGMRGYVHEDPKRSVSDLSRSLGLALH